MNDFRYALRTLRNSPGFTTVVVVLLALGIGASCVMFSALDAVMLKRLAVHDPERLFRVITNLPQLGKRSYMSMEFVQALRDRSKLIGGAFGEQEEFAAITEPAPAEQIRVRMVTPDYFAGLGVNARYGRVLTADDTDAAVISYGFFERRFLADANVLGRSIVVQGHRFTIVGVLPRHFNGISMETGPEVRIPLVNLPLFRDPRDTSPPIAAIELSVRLRPGVAPAQASAEVNSIRKAVEPKEDVALELEPLEHGVSRFRDRFSGALWFLVAAVGILLLMVCANVAGLLLVRSAGRRQEIAVRLALGATRMRLIRQMLTESVVLATIGGVGGLAIAFSATPLLQNAIPPQRDLSSEVTPMALDFRPDLRVLAFSFLLCVATAVLFGLVPAWQTSRQSLQAARATSRWRGRQALMIFEVALCTMLLAGAGLLARTLQQLQAVDAGFDRDHVVTFTVNPYLSGYTPEQARSVGNAWIERVRALPGVESVAIAGIGLMRGSGMKSTMGVAGQRISAADFMNTSLNGVSSEYFVTMGMRVVAGRVFTAADANVSPPPIVVNEAFARHFFPGIDPIGASIGKVIGSAGRGEIVKGNAVIVGVVSDAKYRSLREPVPPVRYGFAEGASSQRFILHVRTAIRPESIITPVRDALRAVDPQLPIIETHTLAEEVETSLWSERLVAMLASALGGLAALLTAVGLYGLLANIVSQRTREIGIRMALGAQPGNILGSFGIPALFMVAMGVSAGIGAAMMVAPAVRSLLYGVPSNDAVTLLFTTIFIVLISAVATAIPLMRAMGIDPAIALRQD